MISLIKFLIIIGIFLVLSISYSNLTLALPTGTCSPSNCPNGYTEESLSCNNGECTRTCVQRKCTGTGRLVYSNSVYLPNYNINSEDDFEDDDYKIKIGSFQPTDNTKCYKFTTPIINDFISGSDNTNYDDTDNFDSVTSMFWRTGRSKWYDNQWLYCSGEGDGDDDSGALVSSAYGAVMVDTCNDGGNDFDSTDRFDRTNELYCAPNQEACNYFDRHCDTDCYGEHTELILDFYTNMQNDYDCHSFNDFCYDTTGNDPEDPEIRYITFNRKNAYMYVREYDTTLIDSQDLTCEYWPECDPADPCCDSDGELRNSGYVCKNAHSSTCTSSSSCNGVAYEHRCDGSSSSCPTTHHQIDYDSACNGNTCVSQRCSDSSIQPRRSCSSGTCQRNTPYDCPNNLNCESSTSCKTEATSQEDCASAATYIAKLGACLPENNQINIDYEYDSNGNLLSDHNKLYEYNSFNQLEKIRDKESNEIIEEYRYDHDGNRILKTYIDENNRETSQSTPNNNYVRTQNSDGVIREKYFFADNKLVGKIDDNRNSLFFHPDHLGSTRLITDESGNKVSDISYSPFGTQLGESDEDFKFTGKEQDDSGLYYFGARYYDPNFLLRFTQPDSIIPDIYNPQDLNRYSYVRNNPIRYIDPDGRMLISTTTTPYVPAPFEMFVRYPAPFETIFRTGTVEFPVNFPVPINVPFNENINLENKFDNDVSKINELKNEARFDYQNLPKKQFLDKWLPKGGKRPFKKPKGKNKNEYKYDKKGRVVDKDGNRWEFDPKEGRWHKNYGDKFGEYENVDLDGDITHTGRSIMGFFGLSMGQNEYETY